MKKIWNLSRIFGIRISLKEICTIPKMVIKKNYHFLTLIKPVGTKIEMVIY
jgi:hypothetical protein